MAGAFTNTGFVTVAGALAIDAGSIVNEQRTARDTALRIFKSKGKTYGQDVVLNVLQAGGEITAGSLRLTATGDISTSGGRLASAGALDMLAGGDVTLAAARVENHESVSGGKVRWTLDTVVIRQNADLYDKALAEWTPTSRSALQGKVKPSSLAVLDSIGNSPWKNLSPEDRNQSDAANIARTGSTMVDALADIRAAEREVREAYGKVAAELNGSGLTVEQRSAKETELKQLRSELTVAAQASNMARMGFDQLLVSGNARGVEAFIKETVSGLADLAWDAATFQVSEKSRQDMLDRADALGTLLGNPMLVADHYRDAYAQADELQQKGRVQDAEQIRAKATLELLSAVAGGWGGGAQNLPLPTYPRLPNWRKLPPPVKRMSARREEVPFLPRLMLRRAILPLRG